MLSGFDIYAAAGGRSIAVDRSFGATVTDGTLNVAFTGTTGNAMVSAVEVVASAFSPLVSYTYRGDGLRYTKTVTSTAPITYTWDLNSGLPVIVQDGSYSYVYGLGGALISQTDGSGTQSYFLGNGLGSTEKLTDGSGNVIASYKYDVFGAVRSSSGAGWTEYRFTGQQDDAALGMTYLRARYYDSYLNRFIQPDTIVPDLYNTQATNRYSYVLNNPVNYTDPTGHCVEDACVVEVAVLTAPVWVPYAVAAGTVVIGGIVVAKDWIGDRLGDAGSEVGASCQAGIDELTTFLAKQTRKSGKERASDIPSWAKGAKKLPGESGKDAAKRILDGRYGPGNYPKGARSEYSEIQKYLDRNP